MKCPKCGMEVKAPAKKATAKKKKMAYGGMVKKK